MNRTILSPKFSLLLTLFLSVFLGCGVGCDRQKPRRVPPPPSQTANTNPSLQEKAVIPQAPGGMELPDQLVDAGHGSDKKEPASLTMPNELEDLSASQISLRFASWESITSEIKASKRVTVVDLWSLSCLPCMQEFPGLVSLHKERKNQVHCVAVNVDYDGRKRRPPTHYEQGVKKFLESVQAGDLPNIICETANEKVYQLADIVSLPSVLIYDQSGNLVKKFVDGGETSGFGYEKDIRPFVESLLQPVIKPSP